MLRLNRHHVISILLIAAAMVVIFAFSTASLLQVAMANLRFIREFGWEAVEYGALIQLAQIIGNGAIALLSWIGFKLCEGELVRRYNNWQSR